MALWDESSAGGGEARTDSLGKREQQVLKLIAEGQRSAAIAKRMSITVATVEAHRRNILRKLQLHSAADLTRFAIRQGLISP
jgi:DNA-binding NarL/FixJ family response regulator